MNYPFKYGFFEVQRFRQTWLWVVLSFISAAYMVIVGKQALARGIFADNLVSDAALLLIGGVLFTFIFVLYTASLKVKISEEGVFYRFIPFHLRFQKISWDEVERISLREYDGLSEYGGWAGVRYGNSGKAYLIQSKYGLQLELKDDRKILLSTQKPMELENLFIRSDFPTDLPSMLQEV